jgi:DNA-binding transcriptional LysR family regulator
LPIAKKRKVDVQKCTRLYAEEKRMNWDDLRIFLAVARSGSISSGAKQLGLQHSTVSRRIRKLAQELEVRLFDRVPSGYELTPAGEKLARAAERMELEVLAVDGTLAGTDLRPAGLLRVTAIDNMATTILMPMFAGFSREYPEVTLRLLIANSDISLARREADVAIRLTNTPPDTLVGKRVATVSSAVYGCREYLDRVEKEGGMLQLPPRLDAAAVPWTVTPFHRGRHPAEPGRLA